jgi:Mg-chelatase subunit ChlD
MTEGSDRHPQSSHAESNRLVVMLDRSASMSYDGKLPRAKQLATERLGTLRDEDAFSVVAFDHLAEVLIPVSLKDGLAGLTNALGKVSDRGNTNIGLALKTAADLLKGEGGQVLILSDGRANTALNGAGSEGNATVEREILEMARGLSGKEVVISAIALGEDALLSFLEKPVEITGGNFAIDVNGTLNQHLNPAEREVVVHSLPEELPAGKPTWARELNTKHVTVTSAELCAEFERSRISLVVNRENEKRARVSLLSIEDPVLDPYRKRAPKTAGEVMSSSAILIDATYRRALGIKVGQTLSLLMQG